MMVPTLYDIQYACCALMLFFGMIAGYLAAGALPESRRVPDKKAELPGKENTEGEREGKEAKRSDKKSKKAGRRKGKKARKGRDDVDEYVRAMTGKACANLCGDLLRELRLKFSGRYNAKWKLGDFYRYLVAMCSNAEEAGSAERQSRQGAALDDRANLPSRRWFHDKIKGVRYDYMLIRCSKMVDRSVRRARRHGMLKGGVDVSIDEHDIPLYAKVMNLLFAVTSKYKKGTDVFTRLATIHCVADGQRMTLAVILVRRSDDMEDVVGRLLEYCQKRGIRINSLTLDRGYYSTRVVSEIKRRGIPFLMPAVRRPRIFDALKAFSKGDIPAASEYTMISDDKKTSEDVTLVIVERPKKRRRMSAENQKLMELYEKQTDSRDKYIPFVTTMKFPDVQNNPKQAAEFYRRRWGIEVSYKGYESIRPWTTSTSHSVRILLLFFPFVVYNAWILVNYMERRRAEQAAAQAAAQGTAPCPSGDGRPACPLGLFASMLHDILNRRALEYERCGAPPDRIVQCAAAA